MTSYDNEKAGAAGQGKLADVIALRGGLAAPEAPFVIEQREALIYMLCQAAELEHGIMCQYLFAGFSLKQDQAEGLTAEELDAVLRWRQVIFRVAPINTATEPPDPRSPVCAQFRQQPHVPPDR